MGRSAADHRRARGSTGPTSREICRFRWLARRMASPTGLPSEQGQRTRPDCAACSPPTILCLACETAINRKLSQAPAEYQDLLAVSRAADALSPSAARCVRIQSRSTVVLLRWLYVAWPKN